MRNGIRPRGAFTLIELLVVLTIISLLAALSISAIFRFREGQRETNTNTHLLKIHMELEKQWKAKVDQIARETPPPAVFELTKDASGNHDTTRAKALHMKLRLRQEFPQNFTELNDVGVPPGPNATYFYRVKPAFRTALRNSTAVELTPEAQSAALLVLILSQGAGGSTTETEGIARTTMMDYPQTNGSLMQFRVFADEWGNPIAFRRWADDDMLDVLRELNQPPFVAAPPPPNPPAGFIYKTDPQDPEGRLQMGPQFWFTNNGVNYRTVCSALLASPKMATPFDGIPNDRNAFNRGPFVFSAGKNGLFGIAGNAEVDLDNLYSYRLAGSGRGN